MRKFLPIVASALAVQAPAEAQPPGQFSGNPTLQFIADGQARLVSTFSYTDPAGKKWAAPQGIVVDGASIPRPFWSIIGSPFTGNYLKASIIHDYYCDKKTRPWRDVHRVFYDGMISGGVPEVQAKIMYYAVYKFGPRWETRTEQVPARNFSGEPTMVTKTLTIDLPAAAYDAQEVARAQNRIASTQLTLEQIEALADGR